MMRGTTTTTTGVGFGVSDEDEEAWPTQILLPNCIRAFTILHMYYIYMYIDKWIVQALSCVLLRLI